MPRSKGNPAYCLHKPSGQARVIIDGRHVYLGPYDSPKSREKYPEIVRKHLADRTKAEIERSIEFATDVTVAEILVRYVRFVESYYQKRGAATGQVSIIKLSLRVLREKFGHLEAKAIGPKALKQCRDEFVRQGLTIGMRACDCSGRGERLATRGRSVPGRLPRADRTADRVVTPRAFGALQRSVFLVRRNRCGLETRRPALVQRGRRGIGREEGGRELTELDLGGRATR